MKQAISMIITLCMVTLLFAGCGGRKPEPGNPQGSAPGVPESTKPAGTAQKTAAGSGLIEYDQENPLQSYVDYTNKQYAQFETYFNNDPKLEREGGLRNAYLNGNFHSLAPMYEEYSNGKTVFGRPVTKKTAGELTTWEADTVFDNDLGSLKKGDIERKLISLNQKQNILKVEVRNIRDSKIISKTMIHLVVLSGGTVLGEFYQARPENNSAGILTSCAVYQYNGGDKTLTITNGTLSSPVIDFSPPENVISNNGLHMDAFTGFARVGGTVHIRDGTVEVKKP